eukprot:TRINITY_DN2767_c0_g1_i2.p1 TRINITY_DN2767_c0_g1~~TRINITY_DN2767_c0_g1_i2.p1  ORF type:complete len:106 (-),score=35.01 TRINITY_DN2767_c0_g1_i2:3-320(-)
MIRRPPRSTLSSSSAASDVYKRQHLYIVTEFCKGGELFDRISSGKWDFSEKKAAIVMEQILAAINYCHHQGIAVSYTHLRAHETGRNLVCRLLLEKKKKNKPTTQ